MRKLTLILTLVAALLGVASAQTNNDRWYFAADFNKWAIPGQATATYIWSSPTFCQISSPYSGTLFFAFNTNAPVYINDIATPTNSEVVTPTSVTNTSTCGFTGSFAHSHSNFQVQSGTAGLQELLNYLNKTSSYPSVIVLDQAWYTQAVAIGLTPATVIAAVSGGTGITLLDSTQSPFVTYTWSGSAYAAASIPVGNFSTAGHGSSWTYFVNSELVTLSTSGQTTDTAANVLPANSIIDMVQGVVNTTITSACTGWELGDATTAARFTANDTTLTAGEAKNGVVAMTTGVASATTGIWQASAAKIRITCAGGNPGAGKVRVVVYGRTFTPPTT